ncbi:MAG: spondin domain-containing protein [Acidobacteriota bacterium]|nr:spondin domain-containing protein [Acidobacteriota bacterium]
MQTKPYPNKAARTLYFGFVCAMVLFGATTAAKAAQFDVTVYNASPQIFSPPIVVSHESSVKVFALGSAPSAELAAVAEDADSEGLIALLQTTAGVRDVAIGDGVILPGESATVRVEAGGGSRVFTVLGMMVTTNDTIYSARQKVIRSKTFYGNAYDAGSEANTLSCAHIPGPPCGNAGVRVTSGAEGVVTISQGINRGSLRPFDWRNPSVKVKVKRIEE